MILPNSLLGSLVQTDKSNQDPWSIRAYSSR